MISLAATSLHISWCLPISHQVFNILRSERFHNWCTIVVEAWASVQWLCVLPKLCFIIRPRERKAKRAVESIQGQSCRWRGRCRGCFSKKNSTSDDESTFVVVSESMIDFPGPKNQYGAQAIVFLSRKSSRIYWQIWYSGTNFLFRNGQSFPRRYGIFRRIRK